MSVLNSFGVPSKNITFLGERLGYNDGFLHKDISSLYVWLNAFFQSNQEIEACYVPALEGGHPDHDVLHTAVVKVLDKVGKPEIGLQYPLYNAKHTPAPFFKVLTPISENGKPFEIRLTLKQKIKYFACCFRYSSQWKTWVGLTPFIFLHLLFDGKQYVQPTSIERLGQRPHFDELYFEARKFISWEEFSRSVVSILQE